MKITQQGTKPLLWRQRKNKLRKISLLCQAITRAVQSTPATRVASNIQRPRRRLHEQKEQALFTIPHNCSSNGSPEKQRDSNLRKGGIYETISVSVAGKHWPPQDNKVSAIISSLPVLAAAGVGVDVDHPATTVGICTPLLTVNCRHTYSYEIPYNDMVLQKRLVSKVVGSGSPHALLTSLVSQGNFPWVVAPRTLSKFVATKAAIRHAGSACPPAPPSTTQQRRQERNTKIVLLTR